MHPVLKQITQDMRREIGGVVLVALGLLGYLALVFPHSGVVGRDLGAGLTWSFGLIAWLVPALIVASGGLRLLNRSSLTGHRRGWAVLIGYVSASIDVELVHAYGAGHVGHALVHGLIALVATPGAALLSVVLWIVAVLFWTGQSLVTGSLTWGQRLKRVSQGLGHALTWLWTTLKNWIYPEESPVPAVKTRVRVPRTRTATTGAAVSEDTPPLRSETPVIVPQTPPPTPSPIITHGINYLPPPLSLLASADPAKSIRKGPSPMERAQTLATALRQFGIDVKLGDVNQGPTITRFEIIPPPGVKVSRIVNLADDIALSLAATGVRIEAPIPGKSAVGIEVPNQEITPVLLREVIESASFANSKSPLTVALGRDVAGAPVIAGLDQMPHLLVAGATGSGKSVLINALITSLLYRTSPDVARMILIDPKVVELSVYNGIPHLLSPVVTDPKKAAGALRWAVAEMERRYRLFADSGVRDIARYNQQEDERLPLIVIVIDELADLMMVAPTEVEESIARLAQMARAAGLHLVVATQRPSVDVITGTIKANIPSRIAFSVSSQIDSRTILDAAGAEKLLGRGDMLFHPVGASKPLRIQGAFIHEKEIEAIVSYLVQHGQVQGPDEPLEFASAGASNDAMTEETDNLFHDAVRIIVESRQASTSMLQRRLRIGYTRAARLIDAMEERGFIGAQDGAKAREVHLSMEQYHRLFTDSPDVRE
ncbi:MAG: FtsK/SpoIIIE family DNA translocase [Sulfobacillus sp.]